MRNQILLLGLLLLYVGSGQAHPIETKISLRFVSALRDEIRELALLNESTVPNAVIEYNDKDDGDDMSIERSPCINLGNDGCVNGSIVGSGGDGGFLGGAGNPGK